MDKELKQQILKAVAGHTSHHPVTTAKVQAAVGSAEGVFEALCQLRDVFEVGHCRTIKKQTTTDFWWEAGNVTLKDMKAHLRGKKK